MAAELKLTQEVQEVSVQMYALDPVTTAAAGDSNSAAGDSNSAAGDSNSAAGDSNSAAGDSNSADSADAPAFDGATTDSTMLRGDMITESGAMHITSSATAVLTVLLWV